MFREMDELMQEIMTSGRGGRYRPGMREDDPDRNFGSDMRNRMLKDPNDPFWRREYRPTEKSAEKPPDVLESQHVHVCCVRDLSLFCVSFAVTSKQTMG